MRLVEEMRIRLADSATELAARCQDVSGCVDDIDSRVVSLRLLVQMQRAMRAFLTLHVAEAEASGLSKAQIAAALGYASPSNIRKMFPVASVLDSLSNPASTSVVVDRWEFAIRDVDADRNDRGQ